MTSRALDRPRTAMAPVPPVARIVVPIGSSDREFLAQESGLRMAAFLEAPLLAMHIQRPGEPVPDDLFAHIRQGAERWGVHIDVCSIGDTDIERGLLAELQSSDLVVIGSERLGGRYHLASIAEALILEAPCIVQVVRLDAASA